MEILRSDIAKVRDENGALIRVISKLSKQPSLIYSDHYVFFFSLSPLFLSPNFFFFLFKKSLKYFLLDDDAGDESNFKPTTSFCFLIRLFHYWIFFSRKRRKIFWPLMFSPPTAPIFPPTPITNKGMSFLITKKKKIKKNFPPLCLSLPPLKIFSRITTKNN